MSELPLPDAIGQTHSQKLRQLLEQRIAQQGPMSFADYMEQVLYEPGLGYYMAGAAKFGAEGDFITAPETSMLFGASLASELRGVLMRQGGGVLEFGAGSGKLALSILQALHDLEELSYTILEPSAELIQRQQQLLEAQLPSAVFARVRWIVSLPSDFVGVIVANEVMDALPVERFVRTHDGVEQVCVTENLATVNRPASVALQQAVGNIEHDLGEPLAPGYCSEICLLLKPWLTSVAQCLERGVIFLVDYGYPRREYYLAERFQGTLACYYRHRSHDDPFHWPGLQDITAHVDFTRVVEVAMSLELELLGYASQSAFLLGNNLLALAEQQSQQSDREIHRIQTAREVKILTLPGEMGERFQVMALGRGYDHALQGFSSQDLSYRL